MKTISGIYFITIFQWSYNRPQNYSNDYSSKNCLDKIYIYKASEDLPKERSKE